MVAGSVLTFSLEAVTQFKHLNKLSSSSEVKREAEKLKKAWFFKSDVEKACDFLDGVFEDLVQLSNDFKAVQEKNDWIDKICEAVQVIKKPIQKMMDPDFKKQIETAILTISPLANVKEEYAFLLELGGKVIQKALEKTDNKS
jgi:hypothetical protein